MRPRLQPVHGILAAAAWLIAAAAGHAESFAAKAYPDVIRQQDVMVAARDGVLLATDVYRPGSGSVPTPERLPVLLHRTPYDKSDSAAVSIAETLAKHGYVVMVQDTRGRSHRTTNAIIWTKRRIPTTTHIGTPRECNGKSSTRRPRMFP